MREREREREREKERRGEGERERRERERGDGRRHGFEREGAIGARLLLPQPYPARRRCLPTTTTHLSCLPTSLLEPCRPLLSLSRSRAHVGTFPRSSLRRLPLFCVVLGLFGCGVKGSTLTLLAR